ncbi:YhcH/YjgK/YiaL family protein [Acerihabitans sp. TG2]|uniref:YhcH/YjgK/YiaL family protein n=1 Tax=Acerihabitans sp. TG2 TaxID=3096008 RepID=UPI002B227431|nr:YhcH/YjgK/YiaL family protein [Acerihabitans sp. TG2]MEA9391141.1 YhcH/YjgK/YiaL family protein [Acerihabitans sp. TG2]
MIVGNIRQLEKSRLELPSTIYQVLNTIAGWNFSQHPDGEKTENNVVYKTFHADTAPAATRTAETHVENIDVQFVISGQEKLEYQPVKSHIAADPRPDQDNYFYQGKTGDEQTLLLSEGDFVVLFPWDIHTPLCQIDTPQQVRKIVAKVPLSLLVPG